MSIAIIINPISGGVTPDARTRAGASSRTTIARRAGVEPARSSSPKRRPRARAARRRPCARGARLVIAWGGDGTINEVASALAFGDGAARHRPGRIGQRPGARARRRSAAASARIADALGAAPRAIDVGEIDGRLFVNIAGIGFDAHVASRFEPARRRRGFLGLRRHHGARAGDLRADDLPDHERRCDRRPHARCS